MEPIQIGCYFLNAEGTFRGARRFAPEQCALARIVPTARRSRSHARARALPGSAELVSSNRILRHPGLDQFSHQGRGQWLLRG